MCQLLHAEHIEPPGQSGSSQRRQVELLQGFRFEGGPVGPLKCHDRDFESSGGMASPIPIDGQILPGRRAALNLIMAGWRCLVGELLSDLFDSLLDQTTLSWPVKLLLSLAVGLPLVILLGNYCDFW